MYGSKLQLHSLAATITLLITLPFIAYAAYMHDFLSLYICAVLHLLFCVTFWRALVLSGRVQRTYVNPDYMDTRQTLPILLVCAAFTVALHVALALEAHRWHPDLSIGAAFAADLMNVIDVRAYQQLAEHWYADSVQLPFFSAVTRAFAIDGNFFIAAVVINALCAVGAGVYLYRLTLLDYDPATARRAVKYLYIFPSSLYFAMPLAGNISLFFSVVFMYLVRKRVYLFAAIAGFCAALCNITGALIICAALVEAFNEWRAPLAPNEQKPTVACIRSLRAALPSVGVVSGLGCYLYINSMYYGDAFYFLGKGHVYFPRATWYFGETANYLYQQTKVWIESAPELAFAISIPNLVCMLVILLLLAAGTVADGQAPAQNETKLRLSYVFYGLGCFVMIFGVQGDLNAPQQAITLFPLAISAAALTRSKLADTLLTLLYLAGFATYFYFLMG